MADPLSGARLKLQRAEEHFGQFALEWASFLERNPYRMLREADLGKGDGYFLWRAKVVEHPPYERWASLVGECAHALRSALDHTAYAIVNAEKLVSEKAKFPLLDHPSKWKSTHPNDLPEVSPEVLTEIERLQPYHGGKPNDSVGIVN